MKEDRKRIKALGGRGICAGASVLLLFEFESDFEEGSGEPGLDEDGVVGAWQFATWN